MVDKTSHAIRLAVNDNTNATFDAHLQRWSCCNCVTRWSAAFVFGLLLHALERFVVRAPSCEPIAHPIVDDFGAELVVPYRCVLVRAVEVRFVSVSVGDRKGMVGVMQLIDDLECAVWCVHGCPVVFGGRRLFIVCLTLDIALSDEWKMTELECAPDSWHEPWRRTSREPSRKLTGGKLKDRSATFRNTSDLEVGLGSRTDDELGGAPREDEGEDDSTCAEDGHRGANIGQWQLRN